MTSLGLRLVRGKHHSTGCMRTLSLAGSRTSISPVLYLRTMSTTRSRDGDLESLPSICQLTESVMRVLGQNPGRLTLQGTNTYLIGKKNPYTLVDTGDGNDAYDRVLESVLRSSSGREVNSIEPDVSDIIISHWHPAHLGGLPSVLSLLRKLWEERNPSVPFQPPRLHKFPYGLTAQSQSQSPLHPDALPALKTVIDALPVGGFTPTSDGHVFHDLHDSQVITPFGLRVVHTPGHTGDSVSLYIPQDNAMYVADTVDGHGPVNCEDLSTQMKSLQKLLQFGAGTREGEYGALYPAHGPVVSDGKGTIAEDIRHLTEREDQIWQLLKMQQQQKATSVERLVTMLGGVDCKLAWPVTSRTVSLHLKKMEEDGVVRQVQSSSSSALGADADEWQLVPVMSMRGDAA